MMTRIASCLPFALIFVCTSRSASIKKDSSPSDLYEEEQANFCHQNASDAVQITGKIYVIKQNFNSSLPPKCDYAERVARINETYYIFTLGAVVPNVSNILVKFNTSFVLSKTGNHDEYNAMTYIYATSQQPKLRKLMYLSPNNNCMIFVDDRNSTEETARCQLLMPAAFANGTIPGDCDTVYNSNCRGGVELKVYEPSCQGLREIPLAVLKPPMTTTPPPKQC
ncbi:uncharacterized protein LOC142559544 [Dermacentor variabilis]|uniref:uncharacterized protein LOC142559544 n=1 Tax=Dermacentor variabilis TaxID=34621 RepID=UPI003F5B09C6